MFGFQIRPINFYKRDREVYKHIAADTLNSRNVLEIEYGEYPMKGIDITQVNERPVHVRGYFQDKKAGFIGQALATLFTLGYVRNERVPLQTQKPEDLQKGEIAFDRAIYLNKPFYSPVGQAGILKFVHAPLASVGYALATGAKTLGAVAASTAAFLKDRWLLCGMLLSTTRLASVVQLLSMPFKSVMDTVGHEHVHVLQVHDENKTGFIATSQEKGRCAKLADDARAKNPLLGFVYLVDNVASFGMTHYFRKDEEIQARLHTVLAKGYREGWHKLPATKHELWGALISAGLSAPAAIRREVEQSAESGVADFYKKSVSGAFARATQKVTNVHVAQLNAAQASLISSEAKERHWREVLPYLYGHLVELYGDLSGRQRMGFVPEKAAQDDFAKVSARVTEAPAQAAAPEQDTQPARRPAAAQQRAP